MATFDYAASINENFKIGSDGDAWTVTLKEASGGVGADGAFDFDCTLKPPETLYVLDGEDEIAPATNGKTYYTGSGSYKYYIYKTSTGSYAHSTSDSAGLGEIVHSFTASSYSTGSCTRYEKGTSQKFNKVKSYCSSSKSIKGNIKIILSDT